MFVKLVTVKYVAGPCDEFPIILSILSKSSSFNKYFLLAFVLVVNVYLSLVLQP